MDARRMVLASVLVGMAWSLHAGWLDGWAFRRQLTVDAAQIDENLEDFPLLIRLDAVTIDFSAAHAAGYDIRFTAGDGTTLLDFEREKHDFSTSTATYWVRLPFVSAGTNTPLYVYFGNRSVLDGAGSNDVWDDGHAAVWHLGDGNGATQADSTANARHLNVYGEVAEGQAGVAGDAVLLSGMAADQQYLANPPGAFPTIDTTAGLTYSAWAYPTNTGTIISCGGGNWAWWWRTSLHGQGGYIYGYSSDGSATHGMSGQYSYGFLPNRWSHVAVTFDYDGGTSRSTLRLYLNGNEVISHSVSNRSFRNPLSERPLIVGGQTHSPWPANAPSSLYAGYIDEARVCNVRRPASWIAASYRNQKTDSTMISLSNIEASATWYPGWKRRRRFTVDHLQISSELTNFPLLVRLDHKNFDFAQAQEDGSDIRFTADDGATPLDYERDWHHSDASTAAYWVRLPLVHDNGDTSFYLYYGHPAAHDKADSGAVWDANHVAVWHLGTSNGSSQADSTTADNHVSLYGTVNEGQPGIVGQAVGLEGVTTNPCYLATPPGSFPAFDTMAGLTYSAWANPTNDAGTDSSRVIIAMGGGNWSPYWSYYYGYYRSSQMRGYASGSGSYANFGNYGRLGTGFPRDVWSHVAMSLGYDAEANESTMRLYVNGGEIMSHAVAGNAIRSPLSGRPLVIGGQTHNAWPTSDPTRLYQGWIDEARISNICRSPAWLAASYHNQKPDSTMLTFGGVEPPRGSMVILR